jgi:hypothetical protein
MTAIYERHHSAEAWQLNRLAKPEIAQLVKDTNEGFGVQTLLLHLPPRSPYPRYLDACVVQP